MMFTQLKKDTEKSEHGITERPWGKFIVINTIFHENTMIYKEKLLVVNPDTSLQLHKHMNYTELWIGESPFTYILEDERGQLKEYQAEPYVRIFIPKNRKHKIISGNEELNVFEAQIGEIAEDDNIKFV